MNSRQHIYNDQSAYSQALNVARSDLSKARGDANQLRQQLTAKLEEIEELEQLVFRLAKKASVDDDNTDASALAENARARPNTDKGGEVFGNVVNLFGTSNRRHWSVGDVQKALNISDSDSEKKAVYNVLDYLVRSKRLKRVRRGQYQVVGYGFGIEIDEHELENKPRI